MEFYRPAEDVIRDIRLRDERIYALDAEVRRLRADRDRLREFFEHMAHEQWGFSEIDGGDFQDRAVEQGLLVEVPADEQFKAEFDCDVMFSFSWSPLAAKEV